MIQLQIQLQISNFVVREGRRFPSFASNLSKLAMSSLAVHKYIHPSTYHSENPVPSARRLLIIPNTLRLSTMDGEQNQIIFFKKCFMELIVQNVSHVPLFPFLASTLLGIGFFFPQSLSTNFVVDILLAPVAVTTVRGGRVNKPRFEGERLHRVDFV